MLAWSVFMIVLFLAAVVGAWVYGSRFLAQSLGFKLSIALPFFGLFLVWIIVLHMYMGA
jgi:hypothetical protein